jgi:hypothetical protein
MNCYVSENGVRYVTMDHTFFTGYRRTVVKPDEVLVSITIPYTKEVSQKPHFVKGVSFGKIGFSQCYFRLFLPSHSLYLK